MNISSTPFIRNDYWPDYNDIDILNKRIDEAENETSLVNSRLTNDIENVSNNLNSYKNEMADTVITNNIIVNNLNANYAVGKYANFANTNTDNAYIENLTVNKPVFDITLNTPHVENITSIGGNFYDANLFNVAVENITGSINDSTITNSTLVNATVENMHGTIVNSTITGSTLVNAMLDGNGVLGNVEINNAVINIANVAELFVNTSIEPVTSSAVLGYDSEGRVIPIKASFEVGFPENANYIFTDQYGTAFKGIAETEVNASDNLITSYAAYNALANVNNSFNAVNIFVNNGFNNVNNSFNNVNNTANNLLDNIDYLKNIVESSLLPANITGWNSSTYPVIIQGITEFVVEPLSADYYLISPEKDIICISNNYYKKNGNDYVKQDVKTYDLYKEGQQVLWDDNHKYSASVIDVDENFNNIYGWTLSNGTLATSGWYLSINETSNTFIVKLLNCTFNNGVLQNNFTNLGTLYKLDTDNSFGSITWYIKNGNKLEKITANTGIVFNTNPTGTPNFYLYQNIGPYTYPNTVAPETASLYTDSGSSIYKSFNINDFPIYTAMETMTAYVGDKAKLSVSGTKATLALPGPYWTKANMDMAFYKCSSLNQKMIIQNSVTSMVSTFEGCSSFNQPDMLIYSQNITNMTNAFKGCNINNVHIPTSVPKSTANFMYNCLVNGNTGITFSAINIFNDLN